MKSTAPRPDPYPFKVGDRVVLVTDDKQLKWLVTGLTGTVIRSYDFGWVRAAFDAYPDDPYAVAGRDLSPLPEGVGPGPKG